MNILERKKTLRREMLAKRAAMDDLERTAADDAICRHIEELVRRHPFAQIFAYYPFRNEPDLRSLAQRLSHLTFALPVVEAKARSMSFHAWSLGQKLLQSRFGTLEPDPQEARALAADDRTLVQAPCLAMDRRGFRVGYGGGFYDRFLAAERQAGLTVLGVVYEALIVDELPAEAHDWPLDGLICETFATILPKKS